MRDPGSDGERPGGARRIFSVMERRDDLPGMGLPLAVLLILLTAVFAGASARLATPVGGPLESQNLAGLFASLPFLPAAIAFYSFLILLWRRVASLLATPVMFGVMLLFGADLGTALSLTLSLLFMSYVFAVCLISRETRFRRLMSLSLATALSLGLCLVAGIGLAYPGFDAFVEDYLRQIPALFAAAANGMAAEGAVTGDWDAMARDLFVMLPAFFGAACVVLAWTADRCARLMFRLFGCEDVFTRENEGVTMPASYAAVYAGVFLVTLLTPSEEYPRLYAMFRSVLLVMALPCAAVGVRGLSERLADRLFYVTRERLLTVFLMAVAFAALGAMPFLMLTSAVGAVSVMRKALRERQNKGEA